jgi:hypothetical protein
MFECDLDYVATRYFFTSFDTHGYHTLNDATSESSSETLLRKMSLNSITKTLV